MYIARKIDAIFQGWKETPDRLPLIVSGARQTGKTESILHFGRQNYQHIVNINFALEPKFKSIIRDGYDVASIAKNITLLDPSKKLVPGQTLILFDELQECPDIATTLKSFKLDGHYDVICSGSMLGINYRRIHSNSVGYKRDFQMYSLDFEEFLHASGYGADIIADMLDHMLTLRPFGTTEMHVYRRLFLDYSVLGGMPAVLKEYFRTQMFSGSLELQRQIVLDYEEDIRKYAEGLDQTKLAAVYRSVPAQLAKENRKFQFSKVAKSARAREYGGAIEWLCDAGVVSRCECLNFPELPLRGNSCPDKFKLYIPDTGLLVSMLDEEAQDDLRTNRNLGVYKGALYENFIAEAFVKQGLGLYYYRKEDASLEEDFFVRTADEIIPVEVKAPSKSMKSLVSNPHYADIAHGIKLADANIGCADNIFTFPYFCAFLLKRFLAEWNPKAPR